MVILHETEYQPLRFLRNINNLSENYRPTRKEFGMKTSQLNGKLNLAKYGDVRIISHSRQPASQLHAVIAQQNTLHSMLNKVFEQKCNLITNSPQDINITRIIPIFMSNRLYKRRHCHWRKEKKNNIEISFLLVQFQKILVTHSSKKNSANGHIENMKRRGKTLNKSTQTQICFVSVKSRKDGESRKVKTQKNN